MTVSGNVIACLSLSTPHVAFATGLGEGLPLTPGPGVPAHPFCGAAPRNAPGNGAGLMTHTAG